MVETTNGNVKNVRKDKRGLELENGSWYSMMKGELPIELKRGDSVTIKYTTNGRYNNIEAISKTGASSSVPTGNSYQGKSEEHPAVKMMNGVFAMTCKYIELQTKLAEINKQIPDADIEAFMSMAVGITADAYIAMKGKIDNAGVPIPQGEPEIHPASNGI